ncbi:MAG: hypothetical protein GEU26_07535 [Nitrososphaeraceae archaeon]|nr:hypothetical protein [Nitrososphaeraceae archaeon]
MSNIGITRSGLTTCKILFSALLLSAIVGGYNAANPASAQQVQQQGTVVESANGTTANESSTSLPSPQLLSQSQGQGQQSTNRTLLASEIEPKLNEYFVWSGLVSSNIDGLPLPEDDAQSAVLLPLRGDDALYSGTLTFQSNSPVDVVVWNQAAPGNDTAIPEDFGDTLDFGSIMNKTVIPIVIASGTSGSVPFVGNTLELIGDDEESFAATYAVNAIAEQPELVSDLTSLGNFTTSEEGEEE